jgi:hypothetical protein
LIEQDKAKPEYRQQSYIAEIAAQGGHKRCDFSHNFVLFDVVTKFRFDVIGHKYDNFVPIFRFYTKSMPYHHKSLGMSVNGSNFAASNNKQTKKH